MSDAAIAFIVVWLLMAAVGSWVGGMRGRSQEGFLLGLLLGPIGIVVSALLPPNAPSGDQSPLGPPPGWYPDPLNPGAHRWWDGRAWNDQSPGDPG